MAPPTTGSAVTVVVPHYGPPACTLALLAMLDAQQGAPAIQVVVVDDASPEPFPDDLRAHPRVHVVRRARNGGFGSAVNAGVAHAEHDLLLVLNSDVEVGTTFVADLLAAAAPWQPAVVSPRVVDPGGDDVWVARHFPGTRHQVVEWLTPLARLREHPRWQRAWHRGVGHDVLARGVTAEVDWVIGAAMLIPTAAFREVGGFDERFFMNAEEVDLQRRLRAAGVRSVVLAAPVVTHSGGGSSDPERRRGWLVDARLGYAEKWRGPGGVRRLQLALGAATAANLAVNGVRRAAGRDVAPVRTARAELALLRGSVPPGGPVAARSGPDRTMSGNRADEHASREGATMRTSTAPSTGPSTGPDAGPDAGPSVSLARRLVGSGASMRWHAARLRTPLLRRAFGALGADTVIVAPARLRGVERIRIGSGCAVHEGAWLQAEPGSAGIDIGDRAYFGVGVHVHAIDPVRIGDGCVLADGVLVTSADHDRLDRHAVHGTGPVVIGDDVFVGQRAVVLGGVRIGDGATVGAHAVVTHDVPAGSTVAGVPARVVETKPDEEAP